MKKTFFYRILIFCSLISILTTACETTIPMPKKKAELCSEMPLALTASAHFVMNGKAYVFGGRTVENTHNNHIYSYNPITNEWQDLGATPLQVRVRPRAVSVGNSVYIGLGSHGTLQFDSTYLQDWWRWTPATNEWKRLANYPSNRTVGPVIMTDEQYIYVAYGGKRNFERWIFRYDIAHDQWIEIKDGTERMALYPPRAHSVAGARCGERFFVGSGFFTSSHNFWVEMEFSSDSVIWHSCAPVPTKRHNAVAISDDRYVYLVGGSYFGGTLTTGKIYDDILRYNPQEDNWESICRLPDGGRENMVGWIIDDTLYVGLGSDKYNCPCSQIYRVAL